MSYLTSFPTVIFTFLLAVCVLWWLLSMLLAGLDVDLDGDAGDGWADELGFTSMPLPLALSILALGGWVTSALLQGALGSNNGKALATGAALGVLGAAAVVGLVMVKLLSRPVGALFATEPAPRRTQSVGSVCKVRTLEVGERFGDAEVVNGATRGSIIAVSALPGRFRRGDLALVVDYDEAANRFVIDDVDELVRPD